MFFSQKCAFQNKNVGAVSLLHFGMFCDILLAGGETMKYRIYDLSVRAMLNYSKPDGLFYKTVIDKILSDIVCAPR